MPLTTCILQRNKKLTLSLSLSNPSPLGKAASTSSEPGHTRRLSTHIKIASDPPVYIYDTPGIMVPFLGKGVAGQETAIKLAMTGGMKESLFERDLVGEYLLWRLRIRAEMRDDGWSNGEAEVFCPPSRGAQCGT